MAFRTAPSAVIAAGLFALPWLGQAQPRLALAQAQSRTGPDLGPAYRGTAVTLQGTVATPPVWSPDVYLLGIQDSEGYGFALKGQASDFAQLTPGDRIAASGTIQAYAGMAVLADFRIEKLGSAPPPQPVQAALEALAQFRYLGLEVTTEGVVEEVRQEDAADVLILGSPSRPVRFIVPKNRGDVILDLLSPFREGDKVRVAGLAVQHCLLPPFDRSYEIIAFRPNPVTLIHRPRTSLWWTLRALAAAAVISLGWLVIYRRREGRRNAIRSYNALGEVILTVSTPAEIVEKLAAAVPKIARVTAVRLYHFNSKTRTLDRLPGPDHPEPVSINPDAPSGALFTGAALAFRSRSVVHVPNTRRSPLFKTRVKTDIPRSVFFTPLFAKNEAIGVLELHHSDRPRRFTAEEQAALQHLANQVAASLRSLELYSVREQLFRHEKLASAAQVVSGIVSELSSPIEGLLLASHRLSERRLDPSANREVGTVTAEAQRASEILTRLVSLGRIDEATPRLIELNEFLLHLIRSRENEWTAQGISFERKLRSEPLRVSAARNQMEHVFQTILTLAAQMLENSPRKSMIIRSAGMARRALIEVGFECAGDVPDSFASQPGTKAAGELVMVKGILRDHSGSVRYNRAGNLCSIEVELPLSQEQTSSPQVRNAQRNGRTLTTLVVDSDPLRQHRLVKELAGRNHRVVPVARAEQALDLAGRVRFDIVVCSARLPGLNWVEFLERTREQVGAYVLLGVAAESGRIGNGAGSLLILEDATNEAEFERVIAQAETVAEDPLAACAKT